MGFGLPAAIGAALSRPDCRVICVSGDGSIMMNIQEMATLKRYNIPVKIMLVDNQALGMVRQWQELFFAKKVQRDRPVGQSRLRPPRRGLRHPGLLPAASARTCPGRSTAS
jgi:thiamine pyrophosphate-dependent acetolactate synthase large subunit-like protein